MSPVVNPLESRALLAPIVEYYREIMVVRDDLYPGGTKARFIGAFFADAGEAVYASPAEGGAQTALATVARQFGRRATIFVAQRIRPHPRTLEAARLGAKVITVQPGYLSVVQARAREYCERTEAALVPFGVEAEFAIEAIAETAALLAIEPDEVWCAAGSGVLARGLARAWPAARRHVVQIGHALSAADVAGATIHEYPAPIGREARTRPPFPSDPHYDAKAWELCAARKGPGRVLFWNVAGPARV
jgi:hypothetical protein